LQQIKNNKMRIVVLSVLFLAKAVFCLAQENPIKWSTKAEKINETEYNLHIEGEIEAGWNIYSQFLVSDDGPVRSSVNFIKEGIELIGKTEEAGTRKEAFDEMFGMNVIKFSKHITFSQKVKVAKGTKKVNATLTYMTCNNEVCLPPKDVDVQISL
jgi:hypothetical protein